MRPFAQVTYYVASHFVIGFGCHYLVPSYELVLSSYPLVPLLVGENQWKGSLH